MVFVSHLQPSHRLLSAIPAYLSPVVREKSPEKRLVWIIICAVLAVLLVVVLTFLAIRLILRLRRQDEVEHDDSSPRRADRERLVFAYFPTQAPAIVRMQRLAKKAGLLPPELDTVAPVTEYVKQSTSSSTDLTGNKGGDDVCAVCLEDMNEGGKTRRLPCGHWFDADCIEVWATKANRCPVCNTHIIDEDELEKRRLGVFESLEHNVRQRRRRTRGENGTFELGLVTESSIESEDNVFAERHEQPRTVS